MLLLLPLFIAVRKVLLLFVFQDFKLNRRDLTLVELAVLYYEHTSDKG